MKRNTLIVLLSIVLLPLHTLAQSPDPAYKLLLGKTKEEIVTAKNYYLLSLFRTIPEVNKILSADTTLTRIARQKTDHLSSSLKNCNDFRCYTTTVKFSEEEIGLVSERLFKLYKPGNALGRLVQEHLLRSGTYYLYQHSSPDSLLVKAWQQDANGVNFAISVYAEGSKARYPNIDSISYNTYSKRYPDLVNVVTNTVREECTNTTLFFVPSLSYALRFIEINERMNAADYEPMTEKENATAYKKATSVKWNDFKYSTIMVPGAGPDIAGVALSGEGMLRCRVAAYKYKEGLAPFIIVSGGKVHPYKTKYCEALEMKRYLMGTMMIPEDAIIIDPHARHTTTNMRNSVRLIFRYHIPFDMPCIASTDKFQSTYITTVLDERCKKELNELPYRQGNRLSETESEFYPSLEALQINPYEIMDP